MKENKHGEIFGIILKFQDRNKIHEYLEDNLTGHAPKLLKGASLNLIDAVRNCTLSPIFIPVKGNPTNKVVIEIDVRPNSHHCGTTVFWMWAKSKSKIYSKNDIKRHYIRQGTSTKQINMSDKKDRKYFEAAVKNNSEVLQYWEEGTRSLSSLRKVGLGTLRASGETLAKVNIVREAYLQGVIDMRSDNHVMRSISTCIKACDLRLDKITGNMLATLVKILQRNDAHSKGPSKIIMNDEAGGASERKSIKVHRNPRKSQEIVVNDFMDDNETCSQSSSESHELEYANRKAQSTNIHTNSLVPPQVQLRHPKLLKNSNGKKRGLPIKFFWKQWTPDDQIEYKKEVDTSGKDTIIFNPSKDGQFKEWIGFRPSQIRKKDCIKAVRVIRPGLSKQDVKPLSERDLEKVVNEFREQRAKGDTEITEGFLKRLGEKHDFKTGQYEYQTNCFDSRQ